MSQKNRAQIWPTVFVLSLIVGGGVSALLFVIINTPWHWLAEMVYILVHAGITYRLHHKWFPKPDRVIKTRQPVVDMNDTIPLQRVVPVESPQQNLPRQDPYSPHAWQDVPEPPMEAPYYGPPPGSGGGIFVDANPQGWNYVQTQQPAYEQQQYAPMPAPALGAPIQPLHDGGHHGRVTPGLPGFRDPPKRLKAFSKKPRRAPTKKAWYARFGSILYLSVTILGGVFYGYLSLFLHWSDLQAGLVAGSTWALVIFFWAKPVNKKYRERIPEQWQLDIMWPEEKNQRIPDHLLWRVAHAQQIGTKYIRYVSRDNPVHMVRRAWWPMITLVVTLGINIWFNTRLSVLISFWWMALFVAALLLLTWYLSLKWWYWAFMVTDEWVHMVRICPLWFPWMNDIREALPFSSIRKVTAKPTKLGNYLGYGNLDIDTDVQTSAADLFALIRYMTEAPRLASIINGEGHRDKDEVLEVNKDVLKETIRTRQSQERSEMMMQQLVQQQLPPSPADYHPTEYNPRM